MKNAIRDSSELRRRLGLNEISAIDADLTRQSADQFPTFVPLELLRRIRPGDPKDPILRQIMAAPEEATVAEDFVADPVGDSEAVAAKGLLHKYDGRALIITTGACGVHCRYCFRREFPYSDFGGRTEAWQTTVEYLKSTPSIDEVLLSGGDPLTMVDEKLFELIDAIEAIPHVKRLRLHTRMPVVIPQRVTKSLVQRLRDSRLTAWTVIHSNHPQELDSTVFAATDALIDAGIPVMNQAVLLRDVNDDADVLEQLCRRLVDHRVMPYYLHQLDKVRGATHFEVPVTRGQELITQLRHRLPGYAVPQYVIEEAGKKSKTPIEPQL